MIYAEVGQHPDETFDIVDSQDRVIGSALRGEIHRRGLLHRAIHIFWLRNDGSMCLQRRSFAKDNCPGLLSSSCAGHVDSGEDYLTAALREMHEELGIRVTAPPERLLRINARAETGWEFCWIYRLRHDGPFVLHPEEIESGEWLAPAEVTRRLETWPEDYCPPFRLIWPMVDVGRDR